MALCPKNIVLFLATSLGQQLGFNLLPALQSRVSARTEAGQQVKGKEGGAARSVSVTGPRSPPVTTAPACAAAWGARASEQGEGRRRERRGRPVVAQPGTSPTPALRSPSQLLCAGVRHSDPPSPRGGNSSRCSAAGFTSPSAKENTTAYPPPKGLAPEPALRTPRPPPPPPPTQQPLRPPEPGNSYGHQPRCACAGTWRYVAARRAKAKGGEEGAPGRRPRPPARAHGPRPPARAHWPRPLPGFPTIWARPLLLLAPLAAAGRGHPRGCSPAQSAPEALIRLRASAGRCFVAERDGLQAVKPEGLFC